MPSHPERVAKQYDGLCTKCLKYKNNDYDPEITYYWLCEGCKWRRHIAEGNCKMPNENIQYYLDQYLL